MHEHPRESASLGCGTTTRRDLRNQIGLAAATLLWALSFVGSLYLVKEDVLSGPLLWLVAALPSAVAVIVLLAYLRYLAETDELQRLIQLQAMALGFGGGFFAICGYSVFQHLGAPAADEVDLVVVMPVLYSIGVLIGWRRYR